MADIPERDITTDSDLTQQPESEVSEKDVPVGTEKPDDAHFFEKIKKFCSRHDAQIRLSILILYVITLAVATIIELLEH